MPTLAHEVKIAAEPAAVYRALTAVADIRNWCTADASLRDAAPVARQGDKLDMRFGPGKDFTWEFVHLVPGQHAGWRCVAGPDEAPGTGVAFDIAPSGDGRTILTLEHKGWPDGHPEFVRCNTRWGALLGQLKHYLEEGTTQQSVA